jgi:protein TonB
MAVPGTATAVVVVRHPVYRPVAAVVTVAVVVAVVAKPPPSTPPPPPSAPPPPPVTTALPIDATMWTLPSECLKVTVSGEVLYQCGPSWLKQQQCEKGPYFQVVPPPTPPPAAPPKSP